MVPRRSVRFSCCGRICRLRRAARFFCLILAAIMILTAAAITHPSSTIHGRVSTPLPTLAPSQGQALPFPAATPAATPTVPGTIPQPPTPTVTPVASPTIEPFESPTPTLIPPASPTATPAATSTPPALIAQVFISEFLANPDAVNDSNGEWIELFSGATDPVNLRDWMLVDAGSNRHRIAGELIILPGQHLVLGRNPEMSLNGGVALDYVYSSFDLANGEDEILLLTPDEQVVDQVAWTDGIVAGASQERTTFDAGGVWVTAWQAWPGSTGDYGSPGTAYTPGPDPIPPSTAEPPTAPSMTPTVAPTVAPTVTPTVPDCTSITSPPDARIYLSEVLANPAAVADSTGEWLELYNGGVGVVNLRCWILSDFGSDSHAIENDLWIEAGAYRVLARNGDATANGGVSAAYVYRGFSLGNDSDEVRLLRPEGEQVDIVRWGNDQPHAVVNGASLERIGFDAGASWSTAWQTWPGSAGDFGSPGAAYTPNPQPEPTDAPGAPIVTPAPTIAPPPDVPPITGPLPRILLSEFLANPDAVDDSAGEWIELYNADSIAVNLRGWRIADLGTDNHTIAQDLIIQPTQYLILGRSDARSENGGANVAYVYASLNLSNGEDEVLLIAPGDREVDRVVWGDVLDTTKGASLERISFEGSASWTTAWQAWPGSAGDFGSPGAAYVPNPNPAPKPPPIVPTATPTPTSTPPPDVPPITGPLPEVYLSEFLANPDAVNDSTGEWIELYNADSAPVNLRGWRIVDLGTDGHTIRDNLIIQPGQYLVLARNEQRTENGGVNVAYVYTSISLSNRDDELILVAPGGREADRVVWGDVLDTTKGASLERISFEGSASWATAWQVWPGSTGDFGSPGTAYVPNPNPDPQPPPIVPTATPVPTAAPPPDVPPITGPLPKIFLSEFLANPGAVNDSVGEWIELYNADNAPVNLRGWRIADLGTDSHIIRSNLVIQPGQYLILGRDDQPSANGGVNVAYRYASISLSNGDDELVLIAPGEREVDRVVWGAALDTTKGASLERAGFDDGGWVTAWQTWPGSAGDFGSPGAPYIPNPNPDPPSPPVPDPTAKPTAPPPDVPPITGDPPRLFIAEFLANPSAVNDSVGEWIELYNADTVAVNLRGWSLRDQDDDQYVIIDDLYILPTQHLVLARNGDADINGGVYADHVYTGLSLANSTDEVMLVGPGDVLVDAVRWGDEAPLSISAGASLERVTFDDPPVWTTAHAPWLGSAGDFGSPGQAYTPPTDEPTPTATPPLAPPPATVTPPPGGDLPRLLISEVLANPDAVGDNAGEWFELYNAGTSPISLGDWQITDLGSDRITLDTELALQPGAFAVLGRNADAAVNGGVVVDVLYAGLNLANGDDELLLLTPDGQEVDRIAWGSNGPTMPRGASLQRTLDSGPTQWFVSHYQWPGSAGDRGTPGQGPDEVPPDGTPSPTPTTAPPDPDATWPIAAAAPLRIEEVAFRSSDLEFVVIWNESENPVSLVGWSIGDAEQPGDGEGMYALPEEMTLGPDARFVIARNGAAFEARYGRPPAAQFEASGDVAPGLARRTDLASGRWALSDNGDEVVLLTPAGDVADAVVYGSGDYPALEREGELRPPGDFSLQHIPAEQQSDGATVDQRRRFLYAPPEPFAQRSLPTPANTAVIQLEDGYRAAWGSLGARSNHTPGFTAPPHYLAAAASATGLDFIALADADGVTAPPIGGSAITLPAWRWEDDGDNAAVVFSPRSAALEDVSALVTWLEEANANALWLDGPLPPSLNIRAIDGNAISAPGGLRRLLTAWQEGDRSLLPAGSTNPPLPGRNVPAPRYTGLAVRTLDLASVSEAVSQGRGWLSSTPGLWLTLRAEAPGAGITWMGGTIEPTNTVTLQISYGDRTGEIAGLALWQNGRPLRQLDIPPADGRWSLTLPALPGSRYFVVATQTDGDFAVTAPIQVQGSVGQGQLRLNEVMFAPRTDYNGDGVGDDNDEYIELFNPGATPVDLSGWQLAHTWSDEVETRRFTFDAGSYLNGGERLVLWRADTGLYLDDLNEYVRLLAPDGREVDRIEWAALGGGSVGRNEESGDWEEHTMASPGAANAGILETGTETKTEVDPAAAQASGPPGSLALAKRYGLRRWVEFEAIVTAPPGLFNASMYVADPAADGATGGLGIQLYLRDGEFPLLVEGDRVLVSGWTTSFRGEMEVALDSPAQIWRVEGGPPLAPLPVAVSEIGEALEGRLVSFTGVVSGYQGESIFLSDPADPDAEPVRVTVRSSLSWRRPYVNEGDRFTVVGIVGQFAREKPWNGGYRVLVRYPEDLVRQ